MRRVARRGGAIVGVLCVLGSVLAALARTGPAVAAAGQPPPPDPWLATNPRFEPLGASFLGIAGVGEYRGSIVVARSAAGVAVVNHLDLDDYLRGVSEVPTSWPIEAQMAQAVVARTYALYEVGRDVASAYKEAGADICATDACQVYNGLAAERRPGSANWMAALDRTRGQVLIYRGAPIVAKYSSSNGGQTVAGGQPYLRAAADPDDAHSPLHRWRSSYPVADVARIVGLVPEPSAITRDGDDIVATSIDEQGNPVDQRVALADFRTRLNNAMAAPAGLPLPVPSGRFDVEMADGSVVIDGRGWGHGIGLSQYGALGKALRGLDAPDILAAYFAGLRPVTMPEDRLPGEVRVAVALDRPEATVTNGTGRFRIVDGDGRVIAHSAGGAWSVRPEDGGKVRLAPPADEVGAPGAVLLATEPATPRPGRPLTAQIDLQGPAALTRITLTPPDGQTRELDPARLRMQGRLTVRLRAETTAASGTYRIDVERDAGGGRVATASIGMDVQPPPSRAEGVTSEGAPPTEDTLVAATHQGLPAGAVRGVAIGLLAVVASTGLRRVRRRRGAQLH